MDTDESAFTKRTLDADGLPPISDEQRTRLEAVAAMPDRQIDYSDAPFLPDAVWSRVGACMCVKRFS